MRLIDADALIQEIDKIYKGEEKEDLKWAKGLHYSKAIIRAQPTVDAVCVVRCKDCRFHVSGGAGASVTHWMPCDRFITDGDWFCGWGERK